MNQQMESMKKRVRAGEQRSVRQTEPIHILAECEAEGLSWPRRVARLIRRQCEAEQVVIGPEDLIVFTRTLPAVPPIYSPKDWARLTAGRTLHELGPISNICADWSLLLEQGLLGRKQVAMATRERLAHDPRAVEFLDCAIESMEAVMELASRYASQARAMGRKAAQRAAAAGSPNEMMAAGQTASQEAMEHAMRYWGQMFDMIVEMQKRLFVMMEEQMAGVPGVKEAKAAMSMMPDLRQAQNVIQAMQGVVSSGGSAFESMQRVMGDFAKYVPGMKR